MEVIEKGKSAFTFLLFKLAPGEKVIAESGAMASCDGAIDVNASFRGGFIKAFFRKFLGGESLFINEYTNRAHAEEQSIVISKPVPGDIVERKLNGETIFLQPGAFVCCTEGVDLKLKWAGFRYLIGGEGLFRLAVTGTGRVWIGVFGTMFEKEINGEFIVDTGHLVAYPPNIEYKLQLSGGLFSSFFSGEGFVGRLNGTGKVYMQTRSLGGMVGWLNPRLPRN